MPDTEQQVDHRAEALREARQWVDAADREAQDDANKKAESYATISLAYSNLAIAEGQERVVDELAKLRTVLEEIIAVDLLAIRTQRDKELRERLEARVLRTPEPTPKQEALMEEFADEMPTWAQLSFVQSEVERMREEVRKVITDRGRR